MKTLSDREMVQGLIDRDKDCIQTFHRRFRTQIYQCIDEIYDELSLSPPKTDSIREDLYLALCDNLHNKGDEQLKDFLSDKSNPSLENWLLNVKLPCFITPERIIVEGLLHYDEEITRMFFFSNSEHALQKTMNIDILSKKIKDVDNGGKTMDIQKLMTEVYEILILGEEKLENGTDDDIGHNLRLYKFDSKSGIGGYINSLEPSLQRLSQYYRGRAFAGREKDLPGHYDIASPCNVDVDPDDLRCFIQKVFQIMSLSDEGSKDVTLLEEHYTMGIKQKDLAISHGCTPQAMNQRINRARNRFRDVSIKYFGFKKFQQIIDFYEKS